MTAELLIERKGQLEEQRAGLIAQTEALSRNINAFNGAIEECQYWLTTLESSLQSPE